MITREIKCKTALSSSRLPGIDYSLNPYHGCQHNCSYCYVPNVLKIKRVNWGNFVDIKINIPLILSKELKRKKNGVIGLSTVTDPYQQIEKKYKITRYCLEQLIKYDFKVDIQTKSTLIKRDLDLISKLKNVEVMMSIGTLEETYIRILEPETPSIQDRLKILSDFSDSGIKTSIFFGPIYPTIQEKDLSKIIDIFIKSGVSYIMIDDFHLKPGIWNNIKLRLNDYPEKQKFFSEKFHKRNLIYSNIRKKIKEIGQEKNITIKDAFP